VHSKTAFLDPFICCCAEMYFHIRFEINTAVVSKTSRRVDCSVTTYVIIISEYLVKNVFTTCRKVYKLRKITCYSLVEKYFSHEIK